MASAQISVRLLDRRCSARPGEPPLTLASSHGQTLPRGVVVEEVAKDSAGEKAGIRPGDFVLSCLVASPPANPEEAVRSVAVRLRRD